MTPQPPRESAVLSDVEVERLARELIDPATPEFSVPIGCDDFERVEKRADEIERDEWMPDAPSPVESLVLRVRQYAAGLGREASCIDVSRVATA